MAEPDPRKIITCPYNMAHQVEHYRMHLHLQKCRKQYPNSAKAICPFDSSHVVNDTELDFHVTACPKRIMLDSQLYVVDDSCRPAVEVHSAPLTMPATENWDDEVTTSYNPSLSKKGAHIITKVKGATPSERRKARMEGVRTYRPPEEQ